MTTPQPHAVIIGAGVAGLSTAYWLGEAGWRTTVLECQPSIAPGGHVMHILGPGRGTLKRMGVLKDLAPSSFMRSASVLNDSRGKKLVRTTYAELYDDIDVVATRRGDLALAIYKILPESATVRFDAGVDIMKDHLDRVEVTLKDGEVIEGDLLIGADGKVSMVRKAYWAGEKWGVPLEYWYATYDVDSDQGLPEYSQSYTAAGHTDILFAPQKDCAAALHIWRDDHIKLPKPGDSIYDVLRKVTAKSKNPTVKKVLEAAEKAGKVPLFFPAFIVELEEWHRGRVVLVGDAAHCLAMLSSQGAGMSIASAEILSEELSGGVGDIEGGALTRWEERVRPSIERLQAKTQLVARKMIPKNKPTSKVRSFLTKMMGDDLHEIFQALAVMDELEMAELDEHKAAVAAVRLLIARADAEESKKDEAANEGAPGTVGGSKLSDPDEKEEAEIAARVPRIKTEVEGGISAAVADSETKG